MAKTLCTLLLRLVAFASTLSAAIIMATSHEIVILFPTPLKVEYSDSPAFKYFVIANGIGSGYGLLILFLPSGSLLWSLVVALDVVSTLLLTSSSSAALAVAYVNNKGNFHVNWPPFCTKFPNYCSHISGALAASFIGVTAYMVLVFYSLHVILNPLLMQKA